MEKTVPAFAHDAHVLVHHRALAFQADPERAQALAKVALKNLPAEPAHDLPGLIPGQFLGPVVEGRDPHAGIDRENAFGQVLEQIVEIHFLDFPAVPAGGRGRLVFAQNQQHAHVLASGAPHRKNRIFNLDGRPFAVHDFGSQIRTGRSFP